MIDDAERYSQLTQLYADYGDEELLELARREDDLTETAQSVLRSEIGRRRLTLRSIVSEAELQDDDTDLLMGFAALAPPECVFEFAEADDARAAGSALQAQGIQNVVIVPDGRSFDPRPPRLAVLPRHVAAAERILSRPIPEEFRELVRTDERFIAPVCPRCHAADPLLESIEPTNQWRCEVCDKTWEDRPD